MKVTITDVNRRLRDEFDAMPEGRKAEVITIFQRIGLLNSRIDRLRAAQKKGLVYRAVWREGYTEKRKRTYTGHWMHVLVRPDAKKRSK